MLAARAAVRASRLDMEEELVRLEAAARAAVDVKAKIKRNPARVAGAAAGIGFLAVGGPRKVVRRARYAVFGKPDPLPEAMLPGRDREGPQGAGPRRGEGPRRARARLRGLRRADREAQDRRSTVLFLLLPTVRILILRFGKQFIEEVLSTRGGFEEQLARVRARRADGEVEPPPGL